MLQVYVALPSGKRKSLSIAESSKAGDLKRLAQKSFEQGLSLQRGTSWLIQTSPSKVLYSKREITWQPLCNKQRWRQRRKHLPCGAVAVGATGSLPGAGQIVAVTAPRSKISSGMCSRFRPQIVHLLRSWQMDPSLHGVTQIMVVTALRCKIISGMCSRFRPHWMHLLRSWQMDLWLRGETQSAVETALQPEISSGMRSRFRPQV